MSTLRTRALAGAFPLLLALGASGATAEAASAAPQIDALSITQGVNIAPVQLSIYGSGFTGATAVHVGDAPVQFTVVSDTRIDIAHGTYFGGGDQSVSVTVGDDTSADTPADNINILTGPGDVESTVPVSCTVAGGATVAGSLRVQSVGLSRGTGLGSVAPGGTSTLSNLRAALEFSDGSAFGDVSGATLDALDVDLTGATTPSVDLSSGGGQPFPLTGIADAAPTSFNIPATGTFAPVSITAAGPGGHDLVIALHELKAHATFTDDAGTQSKAMSCTPTSAFPFFTETVTGSSSNVATYLTSGALGLKNLVKGSVPLSGSAVSTLDPTTGAFSASLGFAPATAKLTALGVLPVVAKIAIEPTTAATGVLSGGVLTASLAARIKLTSVTVFGASIGGGSTCQTARPSTIPLKSTDAFKTSTGGTLAGSFSISNLSGCGALTSVISPVAAGSGNSILLKLAASAPKA